MKREKNLLNRRHFFANRQSMVHKCQFLCRRASHLLSTGIKEKETNPRPFKAVSSDPFPSSPLTSPAGRVLKKRLL